jgi:hypothetical protein
MLEDAGWLTMPATGGGAMVMVNEPEAKRPLNPEFSHALMVIGKLPVCVGMPESVVDLLALFTRVNPVGRVPVEICHDPGV